MIYKLLNYLKEVEVETDSGCVKLDHINDGYVSDIGQVSVKEVKHNEIKIVLLEGDDLIDKVNLTFYNPIENVNGILDENCEISAELIGQPVQDACLINSDWGTYCLGLANHKGHCDFSVDSKLIRVSIDVKKMDAQAEKRSCQMVFGKYVPVHKNSEVLKMFTDQLN
ncbi:MAG TPA: hypothetical protein DCY20_03490 [Firmicutes bacterium]|nr:hypothetical protein [Bacillota bacterium]